MTTIAVLPIKRFSRAKRRLAADLGSGTARALVEAMVTDVLIALRRAHAVDTVLAITSDPSAEALANGYDAETHPDPEDPTHSSAALAGMREAAARGADRVLLVPGDCPALDPKQVDAFLSRQSTAPEVIVVPDRHGTGTNGLLLTPPTIITPSFGPDSRARHESAALAAGAHCEIAEIPTLLLDVDTAADLDALRAALSGTTGNAAHTRGMLSRIARR